MEGDTDQTSASNRGCCALSSFFCDPDFFPQQLPLCKKMDAKVLLIFLLFLGAEATGENPVSRFKIGRALHPQANVWRPGLNQIENKLYNWRHPAAGGQSRKFPIFDRASQTEITFFSPPLSDQSGSRICVGLCKSLKHSGKPSLMDLAPI